MNFITWCGKGLYFILTTLIHDAPGFLIIPFIAITPLIISLLFFIDMAGASLIWFFIWSGIEFLYYIYVEFKEIDKKKVLK